MSPRTFLVRGLAAGLVAGILTFLVAFTVGEPSIDRAIGLEESAAASAAVPADHSASHAIPESGAGHSHPDDEANEGGGISRTTQKTWGLATATVAVGVALGGIVALIAAGVAGRVGRLSVVASTSVVTALGFVAYALVPFLKYPAAPPAVGSGDTIGERTAFYFAFVLLSVVAMVAAFFVARRIAAVRDGWTGVVVGGLGYVAVMVIAAFVMPSVNELGDFPADLLWEFRLSSILTLVTLWAALGIVLTGLLRRGRTQTRIAV